MPADRLLLGGGLGVNLGQQGIRLPSQPFHELVGLLERAGYLGAHEGPSKNGEQAHLEATRLEYKMIPARIGGGQIGGTADEIELVDLTVKAHLVPDVIAQGYCIHPCLTDLHKCLKKMVCRPPCDQVAPQLCHFSRYDTSRRLRKARAGRPTISPRMRILTFSPGFPDSKEANGRGRGRPDRRACLRSSPRRNLPWVRRRLPSCPGNEGSPRRP